MERKTFIYTDNYGDDNDVSLVFDMYRDNNNLFIGLEEYDKEFNYWDSYCDVTVNIIDLPFLYSAIEVNFGGQEKIDFLVKNGFGELTDKMVASGFNKYPVFRFNPEKIKEIDPDFFESYAKAHGQNLENLPLKEQIQEAKNKVDDFVKFGQNDKTKSVYKDIIDDR